MKVLFYSLLIISLLVLSKSSHSQEKAVAGTVNNIKNEPLANVSVTLKSEKGIILTSTYTNEKGAYKLYLPDSIRSGSPLYIWATFLGYKKANSKISSDKLVYNLILEEDPIQLSEVKIKDKPKFSRRGDTLSYDVNSFAREEDRNIGDVINRIPGFTVDKDGKVTFNGENISNLYLGGDDLMGGKYGLATKSISKDMIKSVEVLKNHQPIKVLKDKILTDKTAVNLVLKNENEFKLTGEGMLGGGTPSQFDASGNLIGLSKNLKVLNSIKANNSGVDFRPHLKNLSSHTYLGLAKFAKPSFLTNSGTVGPPDLPPHNYYNNNSKFLSLNNLVNKKNGLQLRLNLQGFIDKNDINHSSNVIAYLPTDTITYSEQQYVTQKTNSINANIFASKNEYNLFLTNDFSFDIKRDGYSSPLNFNSLKFNQSLNNNEYDFTNNFSYIPRIGSNSVIGINWHTSYVANPQKLFIDEGLNPDVINNGNQYRNLSQTSKTPSFFSGLTFSYIVPTGRVTQNYQAGFSNEFRTLQSAIKITDLNGDQINYPVDVGNELHWQNHKAFVNPSYNFRNDRWRITFNSPIQLQIINYKQSDYQLNKSFNQFTINPAATINFQTSTENHLSTNFNYDNNVGDINSVYRGNLLVNYRTLRNNSADLQVRQSFGFGMKYHVEKSISLILANVGFNFNQVTANSIAFTTLTNNVQRTEFVPLKNSSQNLTLSTDFSKYLFLLKTKIQASASYNILKTNLFINEELLPYMNKNFTASLNYDFKPISVITLNLNTRYNYTTGGQTGNRSETYRFSANRLDQSLTIAYTPIARLTIETDAQHIYNKQQDNLRAQLLLLNSSFRYRFSKPRVDLDARLTNLLNVKNYTTTFISSNQLSESSYDLRKRMAILRLSYVF